MANPFADLVIKLPVYYDELSSSSRRMIREEYQRRQKNRCQHCNQPLEGPPTNEIQMAWIDLSLFPPGMLDNPVHLHHSRETGLTIGAVHARCNAWLWQYKGE